MPATAARQTDRSRLTLADLGATPLACGLPPYPRAMVVRVVADLPAFDLTRGDAVVVDRDGTLVAILRGVLSIRTEVAR